MTSPIIRMHTKGLSSLCHECRFNSSVTVHISVSDSAHINSHPLRRELAVVVTSPIIRMHPKGLLLCHECRFNSSVTVHISVSDSAHINSHPVRRELAVVVTSPIIRRKQRVKGTGGCCDLSNYKDAPKGSPIVS